MSRIKWVLDGGRAYAVCSFCGTSVVRYMGRDEHGQYMHCCGECGHMFYFKTPLSVLKKRAMARKR